MKLLYTYFWKTLPLVDLIWIALIWLTFSKSSQIMQPTSNHLKNPAITLHLGHDPPLFPHYTRHKHTALHSTTTHNYFSDSVLIFKPQQNLKLCKKKLFFVLSGNTLRPSQWHIHSHELVDVTLQHDGRFRIWCKFDKNTAYFSNGAIPNLRLNISPLEDLLCRIQISVNEKLKHYTSIVYFTTWALQVVLQFIDGYWWLDWATAAVQHKHFVEALRSRPPPHLAPVGQEKCSFRVLMRSIICSWWVLSNSGEHTMCSGLVYYWCSCDYHRYPFALLWINLAANLLTWRQWWHVTSCFVLWFNFLNCITMVTICWGLFHVGIRAQYIFVIKSSVGSGWVVLLCRWGAPHLDLLPSICFLWWHSSQSTPSFQWIHLIVDTLEVTCCWWCGRSWYKIPFKWYWRMLVFCHDFLWEATSTVSLWQSTFSISIPVAWSQSAPWPTFQSSV